MKTFLLLALTLLSPLAQAASAWEALTEKTLQEGTIVESNFGLSKYIEHRQGSQVVYFTIELDSQTGQAKRYSAVVENWEKTSEGKFQVDQSLFWFTPIGELAVSARYQIILRADKSYESRKELSYGEDPSAADIAVWEEVLKNWKL